MISKKFHANVFFHARTDSYDACQAQLCLGMHHQDTTQTTRSMRKQIAVRTMKSTKMKKSGKMLYMRGEHHLMGVLKADPQVNHVKMEVVQAR